MGNGNKLYLYRSEGFTILELVTVIAVIGILSSVALPSYQSYFSKARVGLAIDYMSGIISQTTIDLQTKGNVDNPKPSSEPLEFLQCLTIEVYENAEGECTDVYIEAWPNNAFADNITLGTTRMLVFNGTTNNSGSVEWRCGPYRNASQNIDASLLPSSCKENITEPKGKKCLDAAARSLNTACRIGKTSNSNSDSSNSNGSSSLSSSGNGSSSLSSSSNGNSSDNESKDKKDKKSDKNDSKAVRLRDK